MTDKQEAAAVWMPIGDLTPWVDNPRDNAAAIPEVAKSIRRFGFASPIIARPIDGGGYEIIAGHTRHKAAQSIGLDRVPVRVMDLDPTDAKLLALADNKVGEIATWTDGLGDLLRELEADGIDLDGLGFGDDELTELMAPLPIEPDGTEDDVPAVEEGVPDSKPGEVYELGPHRLACGDCREIDLGAVDAVVTDPPYGIDASTFSMGSSGDRRKEIAKTSGSSRWDTVAPPVAWLMDCAEKVIVWGGNYFEDLPASRDWLVWDKKIRGMSFADAELAWSNAGGGVRVFAHSWNGEQKEHITQKPVEVIRWCLDRLPQPAVVFDPFAGSGTTLIACAMTGRVARLIELDPRYCDVIRRRWTTWANKHGRDPGSGALE